MALFAGEVGAEEGGRGWLRGVLGARMQFVVSQGCGHQPDFCRRVWLAVRTPTNAAASFEENEQVEVLARGGLLDRFGKFPSLRGEVFAGGEMSFSKRAAMGLHGLDFPSALFAKANHIEGLFDVQLASA